MTSLIDNSARIWDGESYQHVTTVSQPMGDMRHPFAQRAVVTSHLFKRSVGASLEHQDLAEDLEMVGHESEIRMVSFSPNDNFLASGALDP